MMSQTLTQKLCECGCDEQVNFDKYRPRRFIYGHCRRGKLGPESGMYGKKHSLETKDRMRQKALGENNSQWKGDDVGYKKLHTWVKDNWPEPIPKYCQICNKIQWYDLANITGIYNRDLDNWGFHCRSCHMKFDYKNGFRKWTRND